MNTAITFPGPWVDLVTDEQRAQWLAWAKAERAAVTGVVKRYLALSPAARVVARRAMRGGGEFFGGIEDWLDFAEEVQAVMDGKSREGGLDRRIYEHRT